MASAPAGVAPLVIALVNGMPGAARKATEQQFRAILSAASGTAHLELRCLTLPTRPVGAPSPLGRPLDRGLLTVLEGNPPDGLIVTGMPARAASLPEETSWNDLVGLVDFAEHGAIPTVWSCLAAHAAVLHLDGIERRRLPSKLVGLMECGQTERTHPLMAGLPASWRVPHSRYNELPEDALRAAGYEILSRSAQAGADVFVRPASPLSIYCQGHPEYDAWSLWREYQRDILQFLVGERDDYPAIPLGVFGPEVAATLAEFAARARHDRRTELFAKFPTAACVAELRHSWRDVTIGLYANWLAQIALRKYRPQFSDAHAGSVADVSGG